MDGRAIAYSLGKGRTLDIAPQVDIATTKAISYMARTKQRRTYLPYTFRAIYRYRVEKAHAEGAKQLEPSTSRPLVELANH